MSSSRGLTYFPFYPDDFASDGAVEAMSTAAVGAYLLILLKAFRETPGGTIPDDDRILAKWARMTMRNWISVRPMVLAAFYKGKDKRWHQKRMEVEIARLLEKSEKARKSVEARENHRSKHIARSSNDEGSNHRTIIYPKPDPKPKVFTTTDPSVGSPGPESPEPEVPAAGSWPDLPPGAFTAYAALPNRPGDIPDDSEPPAEELETDDPELTPDAELIDAPPAEC